MSAVSRITAYLSECPALWTAMDTQDARLPAGEVVLQILTEEYCRPYDFTGAQRVVQLFNTCTEDYFPAMWVGEDEYEDKLDQYPIYVLDLQDWRGGFKSHGNFKTYMTTILQNFIDSEGGEDEHKEKAKAKLEGLKEFSDETIEKGIYSIVNPSDTEANVEGEGDKQDDDAENYGDADGEDDASPPEYPEGADSGEQAWAEGDAADDQQDDAEGEEGDNSLKRKREDEGAEAGEE